MGKAADRRRAVLEVLPPCGAIIFCAFITAAAALWLWVGDPRGVLVLVLVVLVTLHGGGILLYALAYLAISLQVKMRARRIAYLRHLRNLREIQMLGEAAGGWLPARHLARDGGVPADGTLAVIVEFEREAAVTAGTRVIMRCAAMDSEGRYICSRFHASPKPCSCGREVCDTFEGGCYMGLCPDHYGYFRRVE